MRSIYKCPIPSRCNERKNGGIEEANQKKEWCDVKREEWNLYILNRGVSLGAEWLKEKTKDLQITVSTREYPYQKNRISYISWLTYYTKCRKIHKQKQQQKKKLRIPNTQTSLTLEQKKTARREEKKTKNPYPCSKSEKQSSLSRRKKLLFVNFQSHRYE